MNITPPVALDLAWLAWVASWMAAAFWSDRAAKRAGIRAEAPNRVFVVAAVLLLFGPEFKLYGFGPRLWTVGAALGWGLVASALLGFAFCWWARIHLGRLWSGTVTKKAGHRIVESGPYRYVRHPIYTGLLTAVYATAILRGTALGLAGALLFNISFWLKARLEESFLSQELGAQGYAAYRARVPMLIPFGPR